MSCHSTIIERLQEVHTAVRMWVCSVPDSGLTYCATLAIPADSEVFARFVRDFDMIVPLNR